MQRRAELKGDIGVSQQGHEYPVIFFANSQSCESRFGVLVRCMTNPTTQPSPLINTECGHMVSM
jgi:hypothetical protein